MWILIRQLQRKPAALDPQCYQKGSSRFNKHDKVKVLQDIRVLFVPKITKRSISRLADPEYTVITKPANSPDQTAPLGADFSWII